MKRIQHIVKNENVSPADGWVQIKQVVKSLEDEDEDY